MEKIIKITFLPRQFVFNALVVLFFVFISMGNLFRLIGGGFGGNNLLLSELILYFFVLLSLKYMRIFSLEFLVFVITVLFSTFIGAISFGFDLTATAYPIRLIFMVTSGIVMGRVFYYIYGSDFSRFSRFFLNAYTINFILGLLIYICFPVSVLFWKFLSQYGILFQGDPHERRFVSVYFDPNFFCAIASIPFMFCCSRLSFKFSMKFVLLLFFCIFCIIITWSRSGIGTFLLVLIFMFYNFISNKIFRMNKAVVWVLGIFLVLLFVFSALNQGVLSYHFNRTLMFRYERSAIGRYESIILAIRIILESPLVGIGFNYMPMKIVDYVITSSVDSSIFAVMVCFGLPISMCIFSFGGLFLKRVWDLVKTFPKHDMEKMFFKNFTFYLVVCVIFTSQFNNLLFFSFWLVPVSTILSYFFSVIKGREHTPQSLSRPSQVFLPQHKGLI